MNQETLANSSSESSVQKWSGIKEHSFKIFDQIASTYDLLNRLLSFGIDILWRKKMMTFLPKSPPDRKLFVLDLACGTADLSLELAKNEKVGKVVGMDLSTKMLEIAQKKIIKKKAQKKISVHVGNACQIPCADQSFDLVTISFGIRNFSSPQKALQEIHRVLRADGQLMIMEFSLPKNPIVKMIYLGYFRYLLPFIGKIISQNKEAYSYLNKTVEDFPYGSEFVSMLNEAGFKNNQARQFTFGVATLYLGQK